jgi:hypothetical protein
MLSQLNSHYLDAMPNGTGIGRIRLDVFHCDDIIAYANLTTMISSSLTTKLLQRCHMRVLFSMARRYCEKSFFWAMVEVYLKAFTVILMIVTSLMLAGLATWVVHVMVVFLAWKAVLFNVDGRRFVFWG